MNVERLFELVEAVELSADEKDYLYERLLESYLAGYAELEELLSLRKLFYSGVAPVAPVAEKPKALPEQREIQQVREVYREETNEEVSSTEATVNCVRCGRRLEDFQVMLGERTCVECQRSNRIG